MQFVFAENQCKIVTLHRRGVEGAAPYSICEQRGKLKFDYGSNVTEPGERVTITAAPGTHGPWWHPHN